MRTSIPVLLVGLGLSNACSTAPLQKAAGAFADSTKESLNAFRPIAASAHELCIQRAEAGFLRSRVSGEKPWGSAPKRSEWFSSETVGPESNLSWQAYCNEIQNAEGGLKKIYTALGDYADALKAVGASAKVDGDKLKAAADDAQSIIGKLIPANTPSGLAGSRIVAEIQAAAKPLSGLATIVEGFIADNKIERSVERTDETVQALLDILQNYSDAVNAEAHALQNDTQVLLNWMETRMAQSQPTPLQAAEFAAYAQRLERAANDRIVLQDAYGRAIKALKSAHGALKRAASKAISGADLVALVTARAQTVQDAVKDIQTLLSINGITK